MGSRKSLPVQISLNGHIEHIQWGGLRVCAGGRLTVGRRKSELGRCLGSVRWRLGSMMRRMSQNFTTSSLSPAANQNIHLRQGPIRSGLHVKPAKRGKVQGLYEGENRQSHQSPISVTCRKAGTRMRDYQHFDRCPRAQKGQKEVCIP